MAKQIMMRFSLGDRRVYWATFKYFYRDILGFLREKKPKWDNLNQKWNRNRDRSKTAMGIRSKGNQGRGTNRYHRGHSVIFPKEGSELNVKTG
ncbi:hypothetical protein EVAR_100469_1 [Eumeta japonica]|uniref:Uncharacterized protein n=1 Tax=Eumeta variegata TaxID=151549 RepID=A0A4C1SF37_EUMVA|nr:hypothetical protein EVAR_100469_1 [Eumeta japonica]